MGYPIVMHIPHDAGVVTVFPHDPRCDWLGCFAHVRWEVEPRFRTLDLDIPGDHFCTAHAKIVIRRIEAAARAASSEGGSGG